MGKAKRSQQHRNKPEGQRRQAQDSASTASHAHQPRLHKSFQPFHSAVNRIPVPRDEFLGSTNLDDLPQDLFAEHAAPALDRLSEDTYSGSIDLEMTARTPLIFGDQDENNGVTLPCDAEGNVVLPPTMVKGMVSRAYEILTASRFRVFDGHDEPLTYRADPAMANKLVPGRIITEKNGVLAIDLLRGREGNDAVGLIIDVPDAGIGTLILEGHPLTPPPGKKTPSENQVWTRFRKLLEHGKKAVVHLTRYHGRYFVTSVYDPKTRTFEKFFSLTEGEGGGELAVLGYACRTAQNSGNIPSPSHDLYNGKKYERFFFSCDAARNFSPTRRPLTPAVLTAYEQVIASYREEHAAREGKRDQRVLNRASSDPDHLAARDGDLVFVRLDAHGDVAEILPTMVGRRSYEVSPRELAAKQKVLPIAQAEKASSADRLFGYVIDTPGEGAHVGDVAARGRLFFGAVDTSEVKVSADAKTLLPLLSPKPSSARRFLTEVQPKEKGESRARRKDYFREGQRLGAAAYPVHRTALGKDFPTEATQQERDALGEDNAATRLTAKDWVATGSLMRTRIRFEGLSKDELAALLWVLTPENLVPAGERTSGHVGYLRMGLGKPFGLGTVEVQATRLRLIRSQDLASAYEGLSGALGTAETDEKPNSFPLSFDADVRSWVKAMQRAAYGYDDGVPVDYMGLKENKANNKTDPKTGAVQEGRGLAPIPLEEVKQNPLNLRSQDKQRKGR